MRAMFSTVAPRYDFITRTFSYGMDRHWKRTGLDRAKLPERPVVLDLAAGTGDFSLMVHQRYPGSRAVAVDITERMLQLARGRGVQHTVCGDAGLLPFPDHSFDCVIVGYGLRNFPNLDVAVREIERVTRPGGSLVSLDFFLPSNPCCARCTLPTCTRRVHSGEQFFMAVHGFTRIFPIRCELLSPSTIFRHCFTARATTRWTLDATSLAVSACTGPSKSKLVAGIHQPG